MSNKKKLRENRTIKEDGRFGETVSFHEDLTKPRRSLLKAVKDKENDNVAFCFTRDGSIISELKSDQFVTISDADDLLKIGMKQVDYTAFYDELTNYVA